MKNNSTIIGCLAALGMALTATADTATWFSEDLSALTEVPAVTSAKLTSGTVSSTALLNTVLKPASSALKLTAEGGTLVNYTPEAAMSGETASIEVQICFQNSNTEELALDDALAAVRIAGDESGYQFQIADPLNGWQGTGYTATADKTYTMRIDFSYTEEAGTVSYYYKSDDGWVGIGSVAIGLVKPSVVAMTGTGAVSGLKGSYDYTPAVTPGLTYDTAFKSIAAYNEAVTGEATSEIYANQDTYLVVSNFDFKAGVDYSLAGQSAVKLHVFFYNCTFPSANGTMNPSGPSEDVTASNRKMIALVGAKEVWIEGCTFNAYSGDSYVVDLNLNNSFENEGCGITIKDNNFAADAGARTPLSVKNKTAIPPAFVEITGNYFSGYSADPTCAGVICFGDQLKEGSETANGANFPITIENNYFDEGVTTYKVMTGVYVASGKESIQVAIDTPFTWAKSGDEWVATPPFHGSVFSGGTGTADDPYRMGKADDFTQLHTKLLAGESYTGKFFKLSSDVELANWEGIGAYNDGAYTNANVFTGTFDGNSKTITITSFAADQKYRGLFNVTDKATIKNLTINLSDVSAKGFAGLAGYLNATTVEKVTVMGSASGTHNVAGFAVKAADSTFKNCTNNANISGTYTKVAGFVAFISEGDGVTFENCVNNGAIACTNTGSTTVDRGVGGFVGWACKTVTLTDCSCYGGVAGTEDLPAGSFIGAYGANDGSCATTLTATNCSGDPESNTYGAFWPDADGLCKIVGLNWMLQQSEERGAIFGGAPTAAGDAYCFMANDDAIVFGEKIGDTLTITERAEGMYTGTVTTTVENAEVSKDGLVYTIVEKVVPPTVTYDVTFSTNTVDVADAKKTVEDGTALTADQVPAFEGGTWDVDPVGAVITCNTNFNYTIVPPPAQYEVTFSTNTVDVADAKKTVEDGTALTADQVPAFEGGTWDVDPVGAVITCNTNFNYTIAAPTPVTPVTPGTPLVYDDEESAKKAAETAEVAVPAEVADVLKTDAQKAAYKSLFVAKVTVNASTGKYEVSMEPTETTVVTAKAEAAEVSAAVIATPGAESATVTSLPGLFYSVSAGTTPSGLEAGTKVIGTGAEITVPVKKIDGKAGFFKPVVDVK